MPVSIVAEATRASVTCNDLKRISTADWGDVKTHTSYVELECKCKGEKEPSVRVKFGMTWRVQWDSKKYLQQQILVNRSMDFKLVLEALGRPDLTCVTWKIVGEGHKKLPYMIETKHKKHFTKKGIPYWFVALMYIFSPLFCFTTPCFLHQGLGLGCKTDQNFLEVQSRAVTIVTDPTFEKFSRQAELAREKLELLGDRLRQARIEKNHADFELSHANLVLQRTQEATRQAQTELNRMKSRYG